MPEPPPVAAVSADGTATAQGAGVLPASRTVPVLALPMQWSQAIKPCALAALIGAVAMVLKLMVPVIAALGAGILAVAFYRRSNPEVAIHARTGARLGAICGLFCSGMTAIMGALRVAILHEGAEIRQSILDSIQHTATLYPDPQYQPGFDFMRSPAGLVLMMAFLVFFGFLMLLLLGTLGGTLGGAMFSRRERT